MGVEVGVWKGVPRTSHAILNTYPSLPLGVMQPLQLAVVMLCAPTKTPS